MEPVVERREHLKIFNYGITRAEASNVACFLGAQPSAQTRERAPSSVLVVPAQAERMPGWIQQNPDVVLRLELGDPGAQGHGVGDGRVEIRHLDVEVHHRALLARCGGPDWRHVVFGELKDHVHGVLRWLDDGRAWLLVYYGPAKQFRIEGGQCPRVRRLDGCSPPHSRRPAAHEPMLAEVVRAGRGRSRAGLPCAPGRQARRGAVAGQRSEQGGRCLVRHWPWSGPVHWAMPGA